MEKYLSAMCIITSMDGQKIKGETTDSSHMESHGVYFISSEQSYSLNFLRSNTLAVVDLDNSQAELDCSSASYSRQHWFLYFMTVSQ